MEKVLVPVTVGGPRRKAAQSVSVEGRASDYDRLMAQAEIKGMTGKEEDLAERLTEIAGEMGLSNKDNWLSKLVAEKMRARA